MRVFITGATGFFGRYIVGEALRRGHTVRALVRPSRDVASLPWHGHPALEYARVDLRDRAALPDALAHVDVVIHAAAQKGGDFHEQMEGTVRTTENLMHGMAASGVRRLVAVSTFSVYSALSLRTGSTVTEETPLDPHMDDRDGYAITKHIQENAVREFAADKGWALTILRPGIIFGPGETWNASLGMQKGNLWIQIGGLSVLPLSYVEHCAEIAMLCAERDEAIGETFNAVDDDLPTARRYLRVLRAQHDSRAKIIPLPLPIMFTMARGAWMVNRVLLKGNAKLPGLLVPARLHARFKSRRYSNRKIHDALGWQPRYTFEEALARSCNGEAERALDVNRTTPEVLP
jgi:nucleoside-diphosphate-sugar epimerase